MGIENENVGAEPAFVPTNAWEAWMVQAVRSVVRARLVAKIMRWAAVGAAAVGALGVVAICWYLFKRNEGFDESNFDILLSATHSAAGIGVAAFTAVAVLLGGSVIVELYAQRLDLAIIEADDEGDIE